VNVPLPAPISVVIPAHNAERFIQEAIESVLAQTLPVAEVIVIADDCSDDTRAIARRLGATVFEGKHRNISAATNQGIRAAGQEWIALLDADDFWETRKIESQWKAVQAFPDAPIISCTLYLKEKLRSDHGSNFVRGTTTFLLPRLLPNRALIFPEWTVVF